MQDIVTSFIVQAKECKLRGIGKFRQVITPAETDVANNEILPPVTEFLFTGKEDKFSNELINYIAVMKNVAISEAQALINEWCSDIKSKLKNEEEIQLQSFGSLKKDSSGDTRFHRHIDIPFFVPVSAERAVHENHSVHSVLVGDRETDSSAMNELLNQDKSARTPTWKIISLILFIVAVLLLFIYFYQHPFSLSSSGNHQPVVPGTPPATYYTK
ncbi:MAG: HU family DNA-binding protein [Ginsengibacter sp.]